MKNVRCEMEDGIAGHFNTETTEFTQRKMSLILHSLLNYTPCSAFFLCVLSAFSLCPLWLKIIK